MKSAENPDGADDGPLSVEEVLRQEANAIQGVALEVSDPAALYRRLNSLNARALCLSGGGIRSAAFCLGVIQALALHPRPGKSESLPDQSLLSKFHFLSTVSGGGYIGSWLSAWISRAGYVSVRDNLIGRGLSPNTEAPQIAWLRSYSNYLAPKLGITSPDAWAGIALYLYNLVLNWVLILPFVFLFIAALKFLEMISRSTIDIVRNEWLGLSLGVIGAVSLVLAVHFTAHSRPSRQDVTRTDELANEGSRKLHLTLLWSAGSAIALVHFMQVSRSDFFWKLPAFTLAPFLGMVVYAIAWTVGWPRKHDFRDFVLWTLSGAAFGFLLEVGLRYYASFVFIVEYFGTGSQPFSVDLVLGVPLLLLSQFFAIIVFLGSTSFRPQSDLDQEWLGRTGGVLLIFSILWAMVTFFVLANKVLTSSLVHHFTGSFMMIAGISGAITWTIGRFGLAPATGEARNRFELSTKTVLAIAAPVFAVAIVVLCSSFVDHMVSIPPAKRESMWAPEPDIGAIEFIRYFFRRLQIYGAPFAILIGISTAVAAFASFNININRISLHSLYRNRLVRAFLGASNPERRPNLFTDFDPGDNVAMSELAPRAPRTSSEWQPFHVINITLNTASTKKLAWQERKAEPFTVSPLHSGSPSKGFRYSSQFAGSITLGTAMAISGAAISPSMGYQSTPAGSFVFSLLNLRLGWWLGNPGQEGNATFTHEAPAIAVLPLFQEMLGLTSNDKKYVYLSDGGHFENLGLYEMVRRRCRYILLVDAGRDPTFALEDLGNAVRKIAIDFRIPIRFHDLNRLQARVPAGSNDAPNPSAVYHAVAEIDYRAVDNESKNGILVYIKPSYHGREGADVRSYAIANPGFPHESTADQWFGERQFESYRALGFEIMDSILTDVSTRLPDPRNLEDIFSALLNRAVHDPSKAPPSASLPTAPGES